MTSDVSREMASLLAADEDSAAAALFVQLLKGSALLRHWLLSEFAGTKETRARTAQLVAGGGPPTENAGRLLAWLSGEPDASVRERNRVRERLAGRLVAKPYGGLTRGDLERLVRRYQAGNPEYGPFMLVHAWKRSTRDQDPRLLRASHAFLAAALGPHGGRLLRQLVRANDFFSDKVKGALDRSAYGYAHWWKLSILLYLLNHPKPSYRTRELRGHLVAQRLSVDPKDIRAFCKKHGIVRDSRAGRPRKSTISPP